MNTTPAMTAAPRQGAWSRSASLIRSALRVLRLDKSLLSLPLISLVWQFLFIVLCGAAILLTSPGHTLDWSGPKSPLLTNGWLTIAAGLTVYIVLILINNYYIAALTHGALTRFRGQTPRVSTSLRAANKRFDSIARFSLVASTIGYVLDAIAERVPFAAQVVTAIVGAAWSIASMFALPAIMSSDRKIGPIDATKQSIGIIKRTWGENLIVNTGIGIAATLAFMGFILTSGGIWYLLSQIGLPGVVLGSIGMLNVVAFLSLIVLVTAVSAIVQAALYHYATSETAPAVFERDVLQASFSVKKARSVF